MELKEQFINAVVRNMEPELEAKQLRKLKIVLTINLEKLRLEEECRDVIIYDETSDIAAYKQYFVSMKLRGLSPGTINLAMRTIDKFNRWVRVSFNDVTTNDIRLYIDRKSVV